LTGLLLLLAVLQVGQNPPAESPYVQREEPPTIEAEGEDLRLLEAVREIAKQVERLRGQRFKRAPRAVRAPDTMRKVAADIRAFNVLPRERLDARGRAWADVGLGGPSAPQTLLRPVAADLEGIGFDPEGNRLLVAPDRLKEEDFVPLNDDDPDATLLLMTGVRPDEPLAGHLLMHVRQMEREGRDSVEETTDGLLAHAAWNEGEANLLAVRLLFGGMGMADEIIGMQLDPRDVLDGRLIPYSINELSGVEAALVEFIYLEGFALAVERFKKGGWRELDRAMARQRTTAAILHPGRSLPIATEIGDPEAPEIEGLELVDTDSLGEQAIVVLISATTGKDNLGLMAGDGWVGDRLYRWELSAGEHAGDGVTQWITRWSNEQEAEDFDYSMGRSLQARFRGHPLASAGEGRRYVAVGGKLYDLRHHGTEVRLTVTPDAMTPALVPAANAKTD
jgi:hypothetical protein